MSTDWPPVRGDARPSDPRVVLCPTCGGRGSVGTGLCLTSNPPIYPQQECPMCEGEHIMLATTAYARIGDVGE